MGKPQVIYEDIAVTAADTSTLNVNDIESYTNIDSIEKDALTTLDYITLEWNRWRLNGSETMFPEKPDELEWGYVSKMISDENGSFSTYPVLTITFSDVQTSTALTFDFDLNRGEYPSEMTIEYYEKSGTLIASFEYTPNRSQYCCDGSVEAYTKVVITFKGTCKPYRRLRIRHIYYGVIRIFDGLSLTDISVLEEISPLSTELSVNTLDFKIIDNSDVDYIFQRMQPIKCKYDNELIGTYFIESSERTGYRSYSISAQDKIGILDNYTFNGGLYEAKDVKELIGEVLDVKNISYDIAEDVTGTVTGYLPICTAREALAQIAFAANLIIDTSRSELINISYVNTEVTKSFSTAEVHRGVTVTTDSKVTAVKATAYSFSKSTNEDAEELQNATLGSGTFTLTFDSPYYGYSITGGTIVESDVNYLKYKSTGENVVISGYPFTETKYTHTKNNPNVGSNEVENIKKVENCKLVNPDNVEEVLERLYEYYIRTETIQGTAILDGVKVGDVAELPITKEKVKKGYIYSNELSFGNKIRGEVKMLGY